MLPGTGIRGILGATTQNDGDISLNVMAMWFLLFPFPLSLNSFKKNPCFHFPPKFLSMVVFISIKVHFQGLFINKPFCYLDGIHHVFDDMTHKDFIGFLERLTQEKCQKVYYYQSDLEIPEG
uniref:Uncharacterized protein n=1 Tax=Lactuca sativa TaxID=4236 RepID=A0A9R1XC63_LACSA|nr:hypothetical protein LSAT_V11C500261740 [Lactuca sativa]